MGFTHALRDLNPDMQSCLQGQRWLSRHEILKWLPVDELHHHVGAAIGHVAG